MNKENFILEKLNNFVIYNEFLLDEMKTKDIKYKKSKYDEYKDNIERLKALLESDDKNKFEKISIFIEYEFSGLYKNDDDEKFDSDTRFVNYKNYIMVQMGQMGLGLVDIDRLDKEYELLSKYSLYLECFCSTLFD